MEEARTLFDAFQINVLQYLSGVLESLLGVGSGCAERRRRDAFQLFESAVEGRHGLEAGFLSHNF
ncbi:MULTISPECIES: hypothetical protein [Stenotrophomonas]|uniref:hypothetical protein n=1 Tax=Stenotrophomonas sp. Iso1 TaxID=2977283 RepID=UPI001FDFC94C|nr:MULTISPECIES: hypothetical protein [Stenotrophomonas]